MVPRARSGISSRSKHAMVCCWNVNTLDETSCVFCNYWKFVVFLRRPIEETVSSSNRMMVSIGREVFMGCRKFNPLIGFFNDLVQSYTWDQTKFNIERVTGEFIMWQQLNSSSGNVWIGREPRLLGLSFVKSIIRATSATLFGHRGQLAGGLD